MKVRYFEIQGGGDKVELLDMYRDDMSKEEEIKRDYFVSKGYRLEKDSKGRISWAGPWISC